MDWLNRILGRKPSSAQVAKNRLKLVLSYDRTNLTPEMLNVIQDEIVHVISAHLDIDRTGMSISTQRAENGDHLIADIPIRSLRPMRSVPEPTRAGRAEPPPIPRRQKKDYRRR
jgi:cell division topological specificity factor